MRIKKYIALLLCVMMTLPLFSEITEYATGSSSQTFTLRLNKSGVNKIYFAEEVSVDSSGEITATNVTNNRHIFPLLGTESDGTSAKSISDSLYFVWELDDASGATINLMFVSSDSDYDTGYMLDDVSSATGLDFNYNVIVYSRDTENIVDTEISVTNATVLNPKSLPERTIQVFDGDDLNVSYVKIVMEVIAPIWEEGETTAAFMDAQYAGYIVAELKFTN